MRPAGNIRLPSETINDAERSPNILTLPTSLPSGRSVSFDIPRSPSHKDDKRPKRGSFETMSPLTGSPGNRPNVPEHRSPYQMTSNSSPNLSGIGWSSTTNLHSQAPKIEGLPDLGESIDPNLFRRVQPTVQPPADEAPNPTSDRTPTLPSRNPMPLQPPNYHEATNSPMLTPANISPTILPPRRVALLRLSSLPPPAFTMNNEDGSVRFSPTLIGRHFPTAVRPLPPTSIARRTHSPVPSIKSNASRVRLRSVPALSIDGTDYGDGGGSGDDEDDNEDYHAPITSSPVSSPASEDEDTATEREEDSSIYVSANPSPDDPGPGPSTSPRVADGEKTPGLKPPQDYFSIHPTRSNSTDWMSSSSNPKRTPLTPKDRPGTLYHQTSKSMVNIMSGKRRDLSIVNEETKGKGKATDPVSSAAVNETNVLPEGSRIQRRRSLPTFTEATEPPPYPSLEIPARFAPKVFPRDEEGKEQLPPYSNDILLSAVLPRKLEFTSPGVQARDRKWRRVSCVLEGTVLRLLEPPASGVGAVGRWWERKVGVGDLTSDAPLPKKTWKVAPGSQKIDRDLDGVEDSPIIEPTPSTIAPERETKFPAKKSKLHSSGFLSPSGDTSGASSRRQSEETSREEGRSALSLSTSRPSVSSITSNTTGRPSVSSNRRAALPTSTKSAQAEHVPPPQDCQPLRVYTLQHAESGLASDYLKRKNVIRVRMEGEQFLLQVPSVQAVVDWIEVSVLCCVPDSSLPRILIATVSGFPGCGWHRT
jgi:hypothetical protein